MNDNQDLGTPSEVTSDDKLWALLAYVLTPLVPVIILLMEDKKNRPFLKAHNAQALILGIINVAVSIFMGWLIFPLCLNLLIFIYCVYLGMSAYQGQLVTVPVITDFAKGQGWA
jgi:uncharacterized membrane protein